MPPTILRSLGVNILVSCHHGNGRSSRMFEKDRYRNRICSPGCVYIQEMYRKIPMGPGV